MIKQSRHTPRWDDVEFTIQKSATGYDFHFGVTPAAEAQSVINRLTTTDYVLGAAVIGVIFLALKKR